MMTVLEIECIRGKQEILGKPNMYCFLTGSQDFQHNIRTLVSKHTAKTRVWNVENVKRCHVYIICTNRIRKARVFRTDSDVLRITFFNLGRLVVVRDLNNI